MFRVDIKRTNRLQSCSAIANKTFALVLGDSGSLMMTSILEEKCFFCGFSVGIAEGFRIGRTIDFFILSCVHNSIAREGLPRCLKLAGLICILLICILLRLVCLGQNFPSFQIFFRLCILLSLVFYVYSVYSSSHLPICTNLSIKAIIGCNLVRKGVLVPTYELSC